MIQKISENDKKTVENFLKSVFHTTFPQDNPFFQCLISKEENIVQGFLCYSIMYEQLEINYLYVDLPFRNQHIATQLMESMIDEAKEKGIEIMSLEVNECNKAAQNLYKKFNFEEVAIRKKYYGDTDGILMIRKVI